jgi:hypothetical protein
MHDEFHRRVVVVQQQDAIEIRPLRLRLGLGDDTDAGIAIVVGLTWSRLTGRPWRKRNPAENPTLAQSLILDGSVLLAAERRMGLVNGYMGGGFQD